MGGGFSDRQRRRRMRRLLCDAAMPCGLTRRVVYDVEAETFMVLLRRPGVRGTATAAVLEFHDDAGDPTERDVAEMIEMVADMILGDETVDEPLVDTAGMGGG